MSPTELRAAYAVIAAIAAAGIALCLWSANRDRLCGKRAEMGYGYLTAGLCTAFCGGFSAAAILT